MKRKSLLFLLLFALLAPWAANAQSLWSEDFEGGSMPTGWTTDGSGTWSIGSGDYSTSTGAGQGTYNALITHSTTGNVTKLITPEIDLSSVTTANLSFMHIQRSWAGDIDQLKVYYRASSSDAWTQLVAYTSAVASWTTEDDITLPNTSATYQLAFEHTDNYGYGVGLDDIKITPPASCPKPSGLTCTGTTTSTAELTWVEGGSETEWVLEYGTAADFTGATSVNVSSKPYTITGLATATTYYAHVKANCREESDWSNTVSFSTECDAITTFPWTEDFESYNASSNGVTFADPCWQNIHLEGSGAYFFEVYSGTNGTNSTKQLRLRDMSSGTMTKLRLPKMTLPNDNYLFAIDVYRNTSTADYGEGVRVFVSTDGEIEGATELAFISRSYATSDGNLIPAESGSGWYHYELPVGISGTCYVILRGESKYGTHTYMDNFAVKEAPACPTPTGLAVVANSVTAHTAQLSWTSEATAWEICLNGDEEHPIAANANPFTLTGLDENTAYTAKVRAVCDGTPGEEWTSTVSFTTPIACPAPTGLAVSGTTGNQTTLNWTGTSESYDVFYRTAAYADGVYEQFGTSIPSGWEMYTGLLTDGTATMTAATYGWSFGNNNGVFDNHARVNIYSNYQRWLVTKAFTVLQNASTLSFDLALTAYSGEVSAPQTTGTDDKFIVLISTDNMATWITLREWNNAGSEYVYNNIANTATGEPVSIDLSAYVGQSVRIAFYGESTESNADNNIHIDNVYCGIPHEAGTWQTAATGVTGNTYTLTGLSPETDYEAKVLSNCEGETGHETNIVSFTTEAACMVPNNLAVDYQGGTTATVSWVSDATSWNIEVNGTVTTITENPYTLTGLALATTYTVKVQSICGDGTSDWSEALSFTTDMCLAEDMCEITFELTDNYGDGWNGAYIDVVDVATEASLGQMTNQNLNGTTGYGTNELNTLTLAVCDGREIQFVWHSGSYDSECSYVIKDVNGDVILEGSGSGFETTNYTVSCTVTSCRKPTDLAVSEVGSRTATLTWVENGEATAWTVEVTDLDGGQVTTWNATRANYELTGLTPATNYSVRVNPVCDVEKWSDPITFTTDVACPAPVVEVTPTPMSANVAWTGDASSYNLRYALPDPTQPVTIILTAGDVWSDNSGYQMLLDADATAYGTIIPETGGLTTSGDASAETYAEFEYKIPENADGSMTTTNMVMNNSVSIQIPAGVYDFCITNPSPNDRIWIASANGNVGGRQDNYEFLGGMTYEFVVTLGSDGHDRVDLTVTYNGNGPWIEDLTNVSSPVTLPVNADPLTPETTYIAQVQAVCGGEDGSSLWATEIFTTPSNCDAPNTLTSSVMPTSATLSWTGYQDDFNIQYRTAATRNVLFTESFESGQTTISSTWTEITSGDATGVYEGLPHDGDLMYGFMATDDPQYLITPELEGVEEGTAFEFYHVAYYCDVTIKIGYSSTTNDVSSFTWGDAINISSTGADYVLYSVEGVPAGTKYIGIQVVSMGDYYYFIDDFTAYTEVAAGDWMPAAANVTSPYVLEGLAPETEYEWQVQGNNRSCEDGVTAWSESGSFTTADYCDEPEDLLASDITANAATLSWTGYQNSFNVQYRESEVFDDLSFYEFFNAQGNWTTDNLETSNYEGMASGWDLISGAFAFVYTENPPQTIISPELTIAYPNSTLMFNYLAFGGETYPETFKVGFSTTTNDLASFEWGDEITATNDEYLERYTTSVPDNAKYLAIQCTSDDKYVLAIDNLIIYAYYEAPGDWVNVEVDGSTEVTSPVTIEGLDPNTMYDWQVRGVNCDGEGSFTEWVDDYFTTEELTNVTQTMELSAGKTWFSTYVNITLDNLKDALVAALPGATSITITSQSNGPTRWNGRQWRGQLSTLEVNQMYIIEVPTDCEITLEGEPIDPASCPIDIATGSTWIGFPLSQNMAVSDAFSALPPTRNDIVTSQGDGSTKYMGSSWRGQLTNLEPGKGYIYKSAATDTKTLTYPATSKVSNNDKASNMPSLNKKTSNLPKLQKKGSVGSSRNNSVTAKRFVRTDCKSMPYKRK